MRLCLHMCPSVGSHAPSCGRQLWGGCPALWSISHPREYRSPESTVRPSHPGGSKCGALLLRRRPLPWLCAGSPVTNFFPRLRLTFAMVADAAGPGSDQPPWRTAPANGPAGQLGRPVASDPWGVVSSALSLCCPRCVRAFSVRSVCCVACAVSSATWLLFTSLHARCAVCGVPLVTCLLLTCVPARSVVLRVRCPWPLASCSAVCLFPVLCLRHPWPLAPCSPVCPLGVLCCVCGVLGHIAPVHWCARSVWCVVCAVSLASWFLSPLCPLGVPCVRCPWQLGSCLPAYPLSVQGCVCGVLGHLSPVHRCARSMCCVACVFSLATWLLVTGVPAGCAVCAVPLATWLLFTGAPAR